MKRKILRIIGIFMIICGVSVLSVLGYRKISRELHLRQLLKENVVLEIPALHIKVPVLEGTDNEILSCATAQSMRKFSMTLTKFRLVIQFI